MDGWEISPDRIEWFEKISSKYDIGDTILTSKCSREKDNGFLVVSDKGFAWRIKMGFRSSYWKSGQNMWIRWHDLYTIIQKKPGVIFVHVKKRNMKTKELIFDKKGNYNFKKWKLVLVRNENEEKSHFINRQQTFNDLFIQIWESHKTSEDPSHSDTNY